MTPAELRKMTPTEYWSKLIEQQRLLAPPGLSWAELDPARDAAEIEPQQVSQQESIEQILAKMARELGLPPLRAIRSPLRRSATAHRFLRRLRPIHQVTMTFQTGRTDEPR